MTSDRAPPWLADFQARFGAALCTPLDRSTGTLRATPDAYDRALGVVDGPTARGPERLAVYNRQYWFRLFTVLQSAFALTTRLVGHWQFNDYAARFLLEHPPRGWDVDRACDGFENWLETALEPGDANARERLIEAARIDAAWRRVFLAPPALPYRPSAADAARLLDSRLVASPAVAAIREHWALVELKRTLARDDGQAPIGVPERLELPRCWALVRTSEGIGQLALEAREAELFELLQSHSVADALGRLEAQCSEDEKPGLPARAQGWLARSVQLGFWVGMSPSERSDLTRR